MEVVIFDIKEGIPGVLCKDVRDIIDQAATESRSAVVSPANSWGNLDGGIDSIYNKKMPYLQQELWEAIRQGGKRTNSGLPFLPVGCAIALTLHPVIFISAPTMFVPGSVVGSRNAFYAMYAALCAANGAQVEKLYVPMMCTGVGNVQPSDALWQMTGAVQLFKEDNAHLKGGLKQLSNGCFYDCGDATYRAIRATQPKDVRYDDFPWG